ncbi:hypothetical protein ABS71_12830 [bacterium SCN 62-11]|nr:hypothetical protein [Candidatus Eremiobacteraeota bacterium]ODT64722.1 MAG: hypothetical protein ABS71_12830 [bacterium SCN 62-11]
MVIRPSFTQPPQARLLTKQQNPSAPKDGFKAAPKPPLITWKMGAVMAVPVAAGIYAGLASGAAAGLAGAVAGTPGGALLGGLGSALVAQHVFRAKESTVVGSAIGGTLLGGAAGLAGGIYLGAGAGSPWQAVGMGVLGLATAGFLFLNQDK